VGDQDGGAKFWKQAQPKWKKAGVPLEVHYVKGGQHQWLFGDKQVEALGKWLAKARKIKAPTTQPADEDSDTGEDDDGEQTEVDESDNADE
jgi:hypothetical protein